MWPLKLARIALLFLGVVGLVELGRCPEEAPPAGRESNDLAAQDTGPLVPDLVGGRVPIPQITSDEPIEATVEVTPEPVLEQPLAIAASFAPPDALPANSPVAPSRLLAYDEMEAWNSGSGLFDRKWTESEGLGSPGFNAESCGTCHNAPCIGGAGGNEFNVVQMQDAVGYERIDSPGNQLTKLWELREQLKERGDRRIAFAEIQTPSLLGLGAIDTIPDEEILSREDPNDLDGDGVRGVARRVSVQGKEEIGRFGWKARTPRLSDFVCLALGGELGLTVPDEGSPDRERGFGLASDDDGIPDPEITLEEFESIAFFVANLAPPERGGRYDVYDVSAGRGVFDSIGCSACHVPELSGSDGPVSLYSDLLLHEVLAATGRKAFRASRHRRDREAPEPAGFRTPPLMGVGKTAPYMHDGRSESLRDAILAHEGEASASRDRYLALDAADQIALIGFLEDL